MTGIGDDEADHDAYGPPRWWGWLAFVLSLAGFGISMYLTIDHFTGSLPACSATGIVNCALVTTSKYSHVLGVPVSLAGLCFYFVWLFVNAPPLWRSWSWRLVQLRLVMSLVGVISLAYLVYAEIKLGAICEWCTGVHLITLALFVLVVATYPFMATRAAEG
ncbi:MAG: vitamin K epoxide reductase family protein [Acidimicrobiales bacterium]